MQRKTLLILSAIAFAAGCASTTLKNSWKDPTYSFGNIHSVLVFSVLSDAVSQRYCEDQFVAQFRKHGIQATPSYVLPKNGAKLTKTDIQGYAADHPIDAVLVTRILDKRTVDHYIPPTTVTTITSEPAAVPVTDSPYPGSLDSSSDYYGYYATNQEIATTTSPGYTVQDTIVSAETRFFLTAQKKLIWAGTTETLLGNNTQSLIREYVKLVTNRIFAKP